MQMLFGMAIGAAIETLALFAVAYIGLSREEAAWKEHKKLATDRVRRLDEGSER